MYIYISQHIPLERNVNLSGFGIKINVRRKQSKHAPENMEGGAQTQEFCSGHVPLLKCC